MSQAFKVTIILGYREGGRPVSDEEIADHLREVLEPGGWPGIIFGTAMKVDEFEDPEPAFKIFRKAAKAEGVEP